MPAAAGIESPAVRAAIAPHAIKQCSTSAPHRARAHPRAPAPAVELTLDTVAALSAATAAAGAQRQFLRFERVVRASLGPSWAGERYERQRTTHHEAHAVQCHAGRRTPPGHRRRTEAPRLRNRDRRARTAQEQHLQGRRHPRRALARSLLRRLRRRPPRLPAVQGNLQAVLRAKASSAARPASRTRSAKARN